jgi:simple sugar transport system ATP-binding protein
LMTAKGPLLPMVSAPPEGHHMPPDSAAPAAPARLALRGIDKRYPGCHANQQIDLTLQAGEIHALLGENGAGKSTLVKTVYGLVRPDAGTILWDGQTVHISSPSEARQLGIGMVFQHFSLFDSLTVVENIALGTNSRQPLAELADQVGAVSRRYGLPLDPFRPVCDLSVGERQRVEITRCLLQDPKLIIMDEPTSVLTPQEANTLFATLRQLADEGRTILYISHKLDEIRALCSRATILRMGRVVGACDPRQETAQSLAEKMIGGDLRAVTRSAARCVGEARLVVENLSMGADQPFGITLQDISLTVKAGEIVGIAGVAGNAWGRRIGAVWGWVLSPKNGWAVVRFLT